MECKNCCYYDVSEENENPHCCFVEWGHKDTEIAPCDDRDYEEINYYNYYDYI